jgi:PadR family transcriptional regulator AphA
MAEVPSLPERVVLALAAGVEPGDAAPLRTRLRVTAAGRAHLEAWLAEPVLHVRDMRTEFLVKLAVLDRAGRDRRPLVAEQRAVLEPIVAALLGHRPVGSGVDALVSAWRRSAARAALAFLDDLDGSRPD